MQSIFIRTLEDKSHFLDYFEDITANCKGGNILLIRGKHSFVSSGASRMLEDLKNDAANHIKEWYDFTSNPKKEEVERGVVLKNQFNPDVIIAVGGGSVLDMAKLVRFYSDETNTPLIAIPTTSGTGAESTKFAVCYVQGVKTSVCDESMLPNFVYLDSSLTDSNPPYLTACTGFDALAQAIEAYWNINATEESDSLAYQAISLLYDNLLDVQDSNLKRRFNLMLGANLAGRAINITRTTAPHAMSYTFTSKYGYPHGHAVALTFPQFFELNVNCKKEDFQGIDYLHYSEKMDRLKSLLKIPSKISLFSYMKDYVASLGLCFDQQRPFDVDVVATGINLERAKNNPHVLNEEIIYNVIKSIN